MPLQQILPTWLALNAANDASPTFLTNVRTGATVFAGGLNLGDYFDLTEQEANNLSFTTNGTLHSGRYRRVQLDSGATAANVKTGTVGYMLAGGQPQLNLVTSFDKGIVGAHPVVFLNVVTPGNFCFIQEAGVATCLAGASITKTSPNTGDIANAVTGGVVDDPTSQNYVAATIGIFLDPPNPSSKMRVLLEVAPVQG